MTNIELLQWAQAEWDKRVGKDTPLDQCEFARVIATCLHTEVMEKMLDKQQELIDLTRRITKS